MISWKFYALPMALLLAATCELHAQDTLQKKVVAAPAVKNQEGTYTVQVIKLRDLPLLPYNIDQIVEEKRDAEKVIYHSIGTHVRLKILPLSEIRKKDFVPVKSLEYVSE